MVIMIVNTKGIIMKPLKLMLCLLVVMGLVACAGSPKEVTITIEPQGNEMKFATTEFKVKANQPVKLIMNNTATLEAMKHNVVILSDESKINEVGQAALSEADYIPEHPAIITATPMADAGSKTEVTFNAPTKPGRYVYICTFPGHYMMMQGEMIVE